MELLREVQGLSPGLASWLQAIEEQPLAFAGDDPLDHSRHNHVHLALLEYEADVHPQIDLAFRVRVVSSIFGRWEQRLKGYRPYQEAGYRLYLYEDNAPTISVVAETPRGFPYAGSPLFVAEPAAVLERYVGLSWRARFEAMAGRDTEPKRLIEVIARHDGSIGRATATALRTTTSELRRWIETLDLQEAVNDIRKRHGRRPAQFLDPNTLPGVGSFRVYERKLPGRY